MDPIEPWGMHGAWTPTSETRASASAPVATDGNGPGHGAVAQRKEAEAMLSNVTDPK